MLREEAQHYKKPAHGKRRMAAAVCGVLVLALGLAGYGYLRARTPSADTQEEAAPPPEPTVLSVEWNRLSYTPVLAPLTVQTDAAGAPAMDARLAAVPEGRRVELSYFDTAAFLGDSLTQGMELYATGLPNASYFAYKGVGPNAVVKGTLCKRANGVQEVPLEALAAAAPEKVYVLLGTNVLTQDGDYAGFLAYYSTMLDMIREKLPQATVYVQSITPVLEKVRGEPSHRGMYRERFEEINSALAALALNKGCHYIDLWEALADENGSLNASFAQSDGYHLRAEGYTAWVEYLRTHTV